MRQDIKIKIRKKISGTADRPRLSVYRSLTEIYAQAIDDTTSKTIFGLSSKGIEGGLVIKATELGKSLAELAKKHKVTQLVFDRNGFRFHGAVKALCESIKENGIKI